MPIFVICENNVKSYCGTSRGLEWKCFLLKVKKYWIFSFDHTSLDVCLELSFAVSIFVLITVWLLQ